VLTDEEARQLLRGRLGAQRMAAEPVAVDEVITACARLPLALALAIVASRAAVNPGVPWDTPTITLVSIGTRWSATAAR
jgi:hypothetical protein